MSTFTVERFTTPENLGKKIATDLAKRFSGGMRDHTAKGKLQERIASRYRECSYDSIAEWYDSWYEGHWSNEEPFKTICALARSYWESSRGNISSIKILDCACGTGNTFVTFTKAGYQIFGTDGSKEMLMRAFSNCKASNVSTDNLISEPINWTDLDSYLSYFKEGTFDLIVNTANSFCHIPSTPEYMHRALNNFHRLLKPGGLLLIDTKKYIHANPVDGVPTYMELKYDATEREWVVRSEREEVRELVGLGAVHFHTRLLYDIDPSFSEKVSRALIVITIYGDSLRPRTLVVPYYPLPAKVLMEQMTNAGYKTTIFPAMENLAMNWKYDIVIGQKH